MKARNPLTCTYGVPGCCAASRGEPSFETPPPSARGWARRGSTEGMVLLPGGEFLMGTDDSEGYPADGEGPVRTIRLDPFWIDATGVSIAQFAAFVAATNYVTDAEKLGWSFVFAGLLPDGFPSTRGVARTPWWRQVHRADWRHPEGPHSGLNDRPDHPVVHVSWRDASCHASHCHRYRVAARSSNTPDSSTGNLGFRCVRDLSG